MTDGLQYSRGLVWFRRDLRLTDNAALAAALSQCQHVYCAFVFDRAILDELLAVGITHDRRVDFIHRSIVALDASLREHGSELIVRHANAADAIVDLAREFAADAVFANRDYEPYALKRDQRVKQLLLKQGRELLLFKDHVIFEKDEILTSSGTPFSVYTPYKNAWLKRATRRDFEPYDTRTSTDRLASSASSREIPALDQLGFARTNLDDLPLLAGEAGAQQMFSDFKSRIDSYHLERNYPATRGPSYLSVHLRFGTLSVREVARFAYHRKHSAGAQVWLSELIWRDFYQMILWHHPHVADHAYRPQYDAVQWNVGAKADRHFTAWCEGKTGYPLVDAAMAQLNLSGYMHNRLRMVTASFLTKDLGIDWRRGERYFSIQLNDYDLAANSGGWQWAASTGCDAQPYFRIFNPVTQSEKFDPNGDFIRHYLPQLAGFTAKEIHAPWRATIERQKQAGCVIGRDYPIPVVDHATAREETLKRFGKVRPEAATRPPAPPDTV